MAVKSRVSRSREQKPGLMESLRRAARTFVVLLALVTSTAGYYSPAEIYSVTMDAVFTRAPIPGVVTICNYPEIAAVWWSAENVTMDVPTAPV